MFICRMVFFRLHESPRFLVHAGRAQEALESLQMISRFNGSELSLELDDVDDSPPPPCDGQADSAAGERRRNPADEEARRGVETIFDADALRLPGESSNASSPPNSSGVTYYHSTGESPNSLEGQGHTLVTPATEVAPNGPNLSVRPNTYANITPEVAEFKDVPTVDSLPLPNSSSDAPVRPRPRPRRSRMGSTASRRGSLYETKRKVGGFLPKWIRNPLWAWLDRIAMVLSPEWFRTTMLMWMVWFSVSLGKFLSFKFGDAVFFNR